MRAAHDMALRNVDLFSELERVVFKCIEKLSKHDDYFNVSWQSADEVPFNQYFVRNMVKLVLEVTMRKWFVDLRAFATESSGRRRICESLPRRHSIPEAG